jgi:hypothetical protein
VLLRQTRYSSLQKKRNDEENKSFVVFVGGKITSNDAAEITLPSG